MSRPRSLIASLILSGFAIVAAMAFAPVPASAASSLFTNPTPITIGKAGQTSPYPSSVNVQGQPGRVVEVTVTLHRFGHTWPELVDILLVSPDGRTSLVMSDACGGTAVTNATWIFTSLGAMPMPDAGPCDQFVYRPTDHQGNFDDDFGPGAPPGPYSANFGNFIGANPNGAWRLYVIARAISDTGKIDLGWSLTLDTAVPDALVPASPTGTGVASSYPLTRGVSGIDGVITDVDVLLTGVYHARPADLELVLEGPRGQKVALMSDVCGGSTAVNQSWAWDDEASGPMLGAAACPDGLYRPGFSDDLLPPPLAFPLPLNSPLRDFDLSDPNGEWRLWAYDDQAGSPGLFTQPFRLDIQTRPRAKVGFGQGAVDLTEGQTRELTLVRSTSTSTALGPGSVIVTSSPLSATSASDYKPFSTRVDFAAGQAQKTIPVQALADALAEEAETFALTIGNATGDAVPATPPTAVVTIRDVAPQPGAGDTPGADGPLGQDPGAAAVIDRDAPVLSGVTVLPRAFAVARRRTALAAARGTTIRYSLSEPATVTLRFERAVAGRHVRAGTLRRAARLGVNRVPFSGRVGRRALRRGAYRLRIRATDQAGNRSVFRVRRFRVLG